MVVVNKRAIVQLLDSFSPYLDPEPIADFFDDIASRQTMAIALAFIVHIGLFFTLQSKFIPPVLPPEPEVIEIQIISFEPTPPIEPEPQPVLRPAVPSQAQAPSPKPKPTPTPRPRLEPEPIPEPEPEPIPLPIPTPIPEPLPEPIPEPEPVSEPEPIPEPVTELLTSETIEPEPEVIVQAEPEPTPEPLPEPRPEPVVEIFEPLPEPAPQPTIEIFEPIPEPTPEPAPTIEIYEPEPLPEPEPMPEPEPEPAPIIEIFEPIPNPEPEIEPLPDLPPAPVISEEPVSGAATEDTIPEEPEPIAPLVQDNIIEPEIVEAPIITPEPEPTLEPEIIEPEEPVIITTAPTILASPDAPTTQTEEQTAVPQSQASPLEIILQSQTPSGGRPATPSPRGGGNTANIPIGGGAPNGGTRRANPGATGWTLDPSAYGNGAGAGYKGMTLDIKCRESKRTHEDCPEYISKHQGRDANGYEGFGAHAPRGTSITANTPSRSVQSMSQGMVGAGGWSEDNSGGPSTSIMDDVYGTPPTGGRIRDAFGNNEPAAWTLQPALPEVPEEKEEDALKTLILKPKPVDSDD